MLRDDRRGDRRAHAGHRRTTTWTAALGLLATVLLMLIMVDAVAEQRLQVTGHTAPAGRAAYGTGPGRPHMSLDRARVLRSNPVYGVRGLKGFDCRAQSIVDGDAASMAAFMERFTDCLDRTWEAGFAEAGVRFTRPGRVFWDTPGRGPCGDYPVAGASAFYCPINRGMYVGTRDIVKASGGVPGAMYGVYARVLAHEYSHHVQDQAGILSLAWRLRDSTPAVEANEITRRVELQAQCLAGAYFGAVRRTLPMGEGQWALVLNDSRSRGEDRKPEGERDHGSGANYAGWLDRGYNAGHPGVCDTWTAPLRDVS
ncbi:hypothetical protein SAMN05421505_14610 [Sinosporangium album]|uniref:Neutral zinc metallopeptidase n=1 Tax=Sinosporangium album TaxID=504805 RepID=A0A1G8JYM3_9ACTN|nr:neutral zinc metallopeptidase [Sinosporangium album]SDI36243.1 hypothetical protein SAMN05421505_14610 [Sinosporangium album]